MKVVSKTDRISRCLNVLQILLKSDGNTEDPSQNRLKLHQTSALGVVPMFILLQNRIRNPLGVFTV